MKKLWLVGLLVLFAGSSFGDSITPSVATIGQTIEKGWVINNTDGTQTVCKLGEWHPLHEQNNTVPFICMDWNPAVERICVGNNTTGALVCLTEEQE